MLLRIPCFCASETTVSPAECTLPEGFELWALWVKSCDLISWLHLFFYVYFLFVCPLYWYVVVFSGALIPCFSETQQQFVYVLELAEARGKDSEQLAAQAWDYYFFLIFCWPFFIIAGVWLWCFLLASWQVTWPLEFLKAAPLSAESKAAMKRRRDAMMWASGDLLVLLCCLVPEPWFCLVVCMSIFFKGSACLRMVSGSCWLIHVWKVLRRFSLVSDAYFLIHVSKVLHWFSLVSDACWLAAVSGLQHLDRWPLWSMALGTTTGESLAGFCMAFE